MHPLLFILLCLDVVLAFVTLPDPSQDSVTDYAPTVNIQCPDTATLLRELQVGNQSLHPEEATYVAQREQFVLPDAWNQWLGKGDDLSYNLTAFEGHWSRIGMAMPGGGLRSAQFCAAAMNALDSRNATAKAAGTGGLLQVTSYISGLSGGSWVLGSIYMNDWPTIGDLVFGDGKNLAGWLLDLNLASPDGFKVLGDNNQDFFGSLLWSVAAKAASGIDTSFTDPWARMISYHFLNTTTRDNFFTNESAHGAGQLWSRIPNIPAYREHNTPFPIVVANSRPSGSNLTTVLSLNATVYEITPLEFGSFDPSTNAFMNMTYAGTQLTAGKPPNDTACVNGFDQAGFIMGTSASLFNQIFDSGENTITQIHGVDSKEDGDSLLYLAQRHLRTVRSRSDDVANWPNPFTGVKPDTFQDSKAKWLELLDGSSNQINVPFDPLFVKSRQVDVVVVLDDTFDNSFGWPNGSSSVVFSHRQSMLLNDTHQAFPPIPDGPDAFIASGVNARATFFGCDPTKSPPEYPLLIVLPNAPPINGDDPVTNTATFKLSYTLKHTRLFFDQVFSSFTSGFTPFSNAADPNFSTCLKCAAVDRTRLKLDPVVRRSDMCTQCFNQYCYSPDHPPSIAEIPGRSYTFVDPDPQGTSKITTFLNKNKFKLIGGLAGLVAFLVALIALILWRRKRADKKANYKRVKSVYDDDALYKRYTAQSYVLPEYPGDRLPGSMTSTPGVGTHGTNSQYYDSLAGETTAVNSVSSPRYWEPER